LGVTLKKQIANLIRSIFRRKKENSLDDETRRTWVKAYLPIIIILFCLFEIFRPHAAQKESLIYALNPHACIKVRDEWLAVDYFIPNQQVSICGRVRKVNTDENQIRLDVNVYKEENSKYRLVFEDFWSEYKLDNTNTPIYFDFGPGIYKIVAFNYSKIFFEIKIEVK
jgi:hypothetical protein